MAAGMAAALGLGVVLTMANRLSGPAAAASASMKSLTVQTERARASQLRMETAVRAGTVALIGAGGAAVALGMLVKSAAAFEEGMARVGAVLEPTTAQLKALTSAAVEAGIKTRWSPRQATEGLKELATAGFSSEEAVKALLPVLDLATGSLGQLGVAAAAAAAASAVRGFGFEAKDTSRVVDTLLRSTQLTNIQARDLQVMMGRVSGAAASASVEFEHTIVLLGALRNTGLEASAAATTVRSALLAITKVPAQRELKRLNISIADAQGNFRDTAAVIFDLQKAMGEMTEVQRKASIEAIFGARGQSLFNAVSKMGAQRAAKLESELKNASGTAESFRKRVLEPLSGRLVLMAGSVSTLASQLGTPLLSPIKILVTGMTRFLNIVIALTQWFPRTTAVIMKVVGLVTTITALVGILLILSAAVIALNTKYMLLAKAKGAYLLISKLVFGMDGLTRKQIIGLFIAEKLRITQTDIMNMKMKARLILERILGIGISKNTSITYARVAAAWQERVATLGSNAVLAVQNFLLHLNSMLRWSNIKAMFMQGRAAVATSGAMRGAAAATGIFTGAIRGLTIAMMANPILLIITLVILLAIVIVKLGKAFWNATGATQGFYATLLLFIGPIGWLIIAAKIFANAWKQNLGGVRTAFLQMKKAIGAIFAPLGKLFKATEGVGKMGVLFNSIMTVVMMPFARVFEQIAKAATVMGAILTVAVQEIKHAFMPILPVIDDLGRAFDELGIAVFGRGRVNISYWKRFGMTVRVIVRTILVPLAKVISVITKGITWLTRQVAVLINPLSKVVESLKYVLKAPGVGGFLSFVRGAAEFAGLQGGGIVTKPTVAALAERGTAEIVMPLPTGLRPADIKAAFEGMREGRVPAPVAREAGPTRIVIENRIFLDGREIQRSQREISEIEALRGFGIA